MPNSPQVRLADRLKPLNNSRLLFKIIVGVLAAILVIQTILLVPAAIRYRNEAINKTKMLVMIEMMPMITQDLLARDHEALQRNLERVNERLMDSKLTFTVYGPDRTVCASTDPEVVAGVEKPSLPVGEAELFSEASTFDQWDTPSDFIIPIKDQEQRIIGVLQVSRPPDLITTDVVIFVSRIIGLMVIVLIFVGISTVGYLYFVVVRPLHVMMAANVAAADNDEAHMYVPDDQIPDDEMGDIMRQRNIVLRRLRESQRVLEAWSQELEAKVEQKTAELRRAQEHLIRSEKLAAMGQLAAGVAHEINNPLATIAAHAEDLADQLTASRLRDAVELQDFPEALRIIEDQAYRCKRITKQLLNFARETELTISDVDLNGAIQDTVHLARKTMRDHSIYVELKLDGTMLPVLTDGVQVQQVLLNLLNNAADAIGTGGRITIRTRMDGEWAVIEVEDSGPGIPAEVRDRVFDPFFTTKPVGAGTGLGLSICYGIVTGLGGSIAVEQPERGGARFVVRLPLEQASVLAEPHASAG